MSMAGDKCSGWDGIVWNASFPEYIIKKVSQEVKTVFSKKKMSALNLLTFILTF